MKQYLYIINASNFLDNPDLATYALSSHSDMADSEYCPNWILAGEVEFEINIGHKTVIQKAVECIEKAEQKETAEHEVKMGMLKEKKANLLSITHQPLEVA